MKPHNLFNTDDRAVSPVIGVILMVAITVILAAVIGTFVLGLGDSLGDNQPSAQLSVDFNADSNNNITIEHGGGDRIPADEVRVVVTDIENSTSQEGTLNRSVSVGDIAEGELSGSGATATEVRVRLIHTPSDSILLDQRYDVPDGLDVSDGDSIDF
jgi:flagellin-like protein